MGYIDRLIIYVLRWTYIARTHGVEVARKNTPAQYHKQSIGWIIEAARGLFDTRGWHDVSREDIAAKAGIGVSTILRNFGSKRNIVLAVYFTTLQRIISSAQGAKNTRGAVVEFVTELAYTAAAYPALAIALLPAGRDSRGASDDAQPPSPQVVRIDLDQLADNLGRLLNRYNGERYGDNSTAVSEFYLSGLLFWVLKHPDDDGDDAARIVLSQLL
jgi:AcrR family transcriptional regulator